MERSINPENHNDQDEFLILQEPKELALELMVGKNRWLTKIRWIYTIFIFVFFVVYNLLSSQQLIAPHALGLIVGLSVLANIIFMWTMHRGLKFPSEDQDFKLFTSLAVIQVDFDLVILSLSVFFSGGFESPVRVLFIFYIVIATFLVHHRKALRNTITANVLVVVIFLSSERLVLSSDRFMELIAFNLLLLFAFFISAYLSQNISKNEEKIRKLLLRTREMSVTDGLTGLYNQSHFFLLLKLQLEKARRYHTSFSLILFDLDNFKSYNDFNGHRKGSDALRHIGVLMRGVFRSSDMLSKYGGDEFVVILPNSDKVGAFLAADRLREVVEEEPFEGEESQPLGKVTLSLGVASYPEHAQTMEELLDRADKALYFAKESGRNKTAIYNDDLEEGPTATD